MSPLTGVKVYLFTAGGSYMGQNQTTDGNGEVIFSLPAREYKFRADYLNQEYWSEIINQADTTITIYHGLAAVNVNDGGNPLGGVNVYVFNSGGSYLGIHDQTDSAGDVSFELPAGEYKFRADYNGTQYWSEIETIVADQTTNINIDIQTASQSFLDRPHHTLYDKKRIMLASLGNLKGILANTIITQIPGDEVYYYHNDHLGTPPKMTNSIGTIIWEADYLPFGKAMVDEDPDGDEVDVTNNIRFPGQYYDKETELHYNRFRYYNEQTGRYLMIDPFAFGFGDGSNVYLYVDANPIRYKDILGLFKICTPWIDLEGEEELVSSYTEWRFAGSIEQGFGPNMSVQCHWRKVREEYIQTLVTPTRWCLDTKCADKIKKEQKLPYYKSGIREKTIDYITTPAKWIPTGDGISSFYICDPRYRSPFFRYPEDFPQ